MTPRRIHVLAVVLAALAGIQAVATGSLIAGFVFAVTCVPCAFLAVRALRQVDLDEMYERLAGRDLGEPEGP